MSSDDQAFTGPETIPERNWPCLRQFCVFIENRVGSLHELMRNLERHDLRVVALSIDNSVDFAVVRLMVDSYERARELFHLGGYSVIESDIIGVELPDSSQPYLSVCTTLLQAEINIHYTYPLLYRRGGRGAIAMFVDDIDRSLELLVDKGHQIITENDLSEDDEYI